MDMFKGILKYALQNKVSFIHIVSNQPPVMRDVNGQPLDPGMKPCDPQWLTGVMYSLFPGEQNKVTQQQPILGQLPIPGGNKVMLIAQPGSSPEMTVYLSDKAEQQCMVHWQQLQKQVTPEAGPVEPPQPPSTPTEDQQQPPMETEESSIPLPFSEESAAEELATENVLPPPPPLQDTNVASTIEPEANESLQTEAFASQTHLESTDDSTPEDDIPAPGFSLAPQQLPEESFQEEQHTPEQPPPFPGFSPEAEENSSFPEPPTSQQPETDNPPDWDPFGSKPMDIDTQTEHKMESTDISPLQEEGLEINASDDPFPPPFALESDRLDEKSEPLQMSFHVHTPDHSEDFQIAPPPPHPPEQVDLAIPQPPSPPHTQHSNATPPPPPIPQAAPPHIINPDEVFRARLAGETSSGAQTVVIDRVLKDMVQRGASDLHLSTGMPPYFRLSGSLQPFQEEVMTPSSLKEWLWPTLPKHCQEQFAESWDTDYAYALDGIGRFRFNLFRDQRGVGAVIRQIPEEIPTAQQLNLPESILKFCHLSKGLVLVTGPTGSGKSTTLAAMINEINRTRNDHIITVEDPVEFVHTPQKCLINHREVGTHTASFARALKAALREDPDIVLVGEMRDLETVEMAIETAETGHLVFGTLHTTTAASTVDRLVNQFPGEQQAQIRSMLSNSLAGVVSQVLCPTLDGKRAAAFEVLVRDTAISNLIRESKIHMIPGHMETQSAAGNILMDDSLMKLLQAQKISFENAYRRANRPSRFKEVAKQKGLSNG